MEDMEGKYGWLWLCGIPGFYEPDRKKLLQAFGTPANIRRAAEQIPEALLFLGEKKHSAIRKHSRTFPAQEEYHKLAARGIRFISCEDEAYPQRLLHLPDYPSGLFCMGSLPEQEEPLVAVIGARMCTYNGRNTARRLAARLAENGVGVVSGMAYGIDGCAQNACLAAGGKSYAVLGCGVDICYPPENYELYQMLAGSGGILSEFYPGTRPLAFHFPIRNRIISGLAKTVVVVEARKKSGTLITADLALEQGKDVYAFPGRPQDALSTGCNSLIRQGAGMITDINEFLEENGYLKKEEKKQENIKLGLATSENLLYSCLDSESKSLSDLTEETRLPVQELMRILGALQAKGLIREIAKNHYVRMR